MRSPGSPRSRPIATPPRVGLVLGAGGVVGQAYQAGVLVALAHDLGWDPRDAAVIVGTSAGSVTGTLLRLGVPADDLAAWAVEAPLSAETHRLHEALEDEREFPPWNGGTSCGDGAHRLPLSWSVRPADLGDSEPRWPPRPCSRPDVTTSRRAAHRSMT